MKLSVFGSSDIIKHHIKAAKRNSFNIFGIYSSNKKSKNVIELAKKFKIKKIYQDWELLIKDSVENNCSILIAGRIKDNKKILENCLKHDLKVLVEKPVFCGSDEYNNFLKFKKKIFVGYNRIYYKNISKLNKIILNEKLFNVIVKCPEENQKNILLNSCHIISILYYLCGKIFLIKKVKNKNSIMCFFKTKSNIPIFLNINFGSPDNFLLEFNFKNKRAVLCPIEKLTIYNKLNKIKYRDGNVYKPNILEIVNEYKLSKLKPGFDTQYANFKRFIKNKKSQHINITDAKKIMSICTKIIE